MSVEAELLPESMTDLVDIIGLPAVLDLMESFGGTELWIPEKLQHNHLLVDAIGAEAAQLLCEYMARERVRIPRGAAIRLEIRNRAMRRERQEGAKISELAIRWRLTDRQVITILNAAPVDDRQQDMFA